MLDVKSQIRDHLKRATGQADLSDDQNIFEDGIVNSLFALELVLYIEKQFALTIENDDMEVANFASIDAIAAFVLRKIENA